MISDSDESKSQVTRTSPSHRRGSPLAPLRPFDRPGKKGEAGRARALLHSGCTSQEARGGGPTTLYCPGSDGGQAGPAHGAGVFRAFLLGGRRLVSVAQ